MNKTEKYILLLQSIIFYTKNSFCLYAKQQNLKKCPQLVRYQVGQERTLRPGLDLRHGRLFAAKTAARISNFAF